MFRVQGLGFGVQGLGPFRVNTLSTATGLDPTLLYSPAIDNPTGACRESLVLAEVFRKPLNLAA